MLRRSRSNSTLPADVAPAMAALLFALLGLGAVACGDRKPERSGRSASLPPDITLPPASVTEPPIPEPVSETRVIPENVSFEDADSAFRERRYGDAVSLFTGYVGRRPGNTWGHYMLGLSAWKASEHEKAERAFEEALRLDPKHVKSLLNWSRVLLETGRPEQALEKIETALAIDSTSSDVFRLRGLALSELGCPEDAIEAYRRAIVLEGVDAWSMNNLGLVRIREGRFEEALGPLARAVEIRQDLPTFWNNLGIALERTGHLRDAEEAYRKALAADGRYEKASVSLARVEVLSEDPTVQPIDLAVLARGFEEEVRGWRQSTLSQVSDGVTGSDSRDTSRSVVVTPPERTPTPPDQR